MKPLLLTAGISAIDLPSDAPKSADSSQVGRAVRAGGPAWSAALAARDDLRQGLGAQVRRLAVDREPVEDLAVPVDLLALVQVEGADQLLDVDHVRQLRLREPQDAEGAALGGVTTEPERHDLDRHVLQLAQLQQMFELGPH